MKLVLTLLVSLCALTIPRVSWAQPATDPTTEARERFGRGLRLFNDGDNAGALAEFERAYALSPHPSVLYNIGLVNAAVASGSIGKVKRRNP